MSSNYAVCYVTLAVSNLERSLAFYQDTLGLAVRLEYEPTRWVAFDMRGGTGLALMETGPAGAGGSGAAGVVDLWVDDVEALWQRLRDRVPVVRRLERTPWGSHKFIVADPDGNRLGFVARQPAMEPPLS